MFFVLCDTSVLLCCDVLQTNVQVIKPGSRIITAAPSSLTSVQRELSHFGAPWGSGLPIDPETGLTQGKLPRLSNTCTIDNVITIFNFLFFEFPVAKEFFEQCSSPVCTALLDIHVCALKGDWHTAKIKWLAFTGRDTSARDVNLLGDEAEESFNHLAPLMLSFSSSVCHGGSCLQPTLTYQRSIPFLTGRPGYHRPAPFSEQQAFLCKLIQNWLHPPPEPCGSLSACPSHADLFVEGEDDIQRCSGQRQHSARSFAMPVLPLLSFHIHHFIQMGAVTSMEGVPATIPVNGQSFRFLAATFYAGGHYSAAFCDRDCQWYFYDGLNEAESRISFVGSVKKIPLASMNHILYVNECLLGG